VSQSQSPLDREPTFTFIKDAVDKGETNATIVRQLAFQGVESSENSIRRFRKRHSLNPAAFDPAFTEIKGDVAEASTGPQQILDDPDTMLRQRGLDPEEWEITGLRANEYEGPNSADAAAETGEAKIKYYQTRFNVVRKRALLPFPTRSDGWVRPKINIKVDKGKPKTWVVVGDQQAPFHDKKLHQAFLYMLDDTQPHGVINNGDLIDLPDESRHPDDPQNTAAIGECFQGGYDILRDEIDASPNSEFVFLPGNHDVRVYDLLLKDRKTAPIATFTRPTAPGEEPESPLVSLPHTLRLDELGVQYVDPHGGYEHGQFKLSKYLAVRHGWVVRKGSGASALGTLESLGYSVIINHTHRQSVVHKTTNDIDGTLSTLTAVEGGCMCRVDINPHPSDGRRFPSYATNPDWQQGFVTATVYPDGYFTIDRAIYINGNLLYRDKRYN
jgi:hypothetical protein